MFCSKCGKALADDAAFCSGCGSPTGNTQQSPERKPEVAKGILLILAGVAIIIATILCAIAQYNGF